MNIMNNYNLMNIISFNNQENVGDYNGKNITLNTIIHQSAYQHFITSLLCDFSSIISIPQINV